ncbi:hypothetical protein GCM10010207_12670 [Streptomyces atratus]|nr:hypothetical protein GCM10010207_12670 [Streptomyces atratus]
MPAISTGCSGTPAPINTWGSTSHTAARGTTGTRSRAILLRSQARADFADRKEKKLAAPPAKNTMGMTCVSHVTIHQPGLARAFPVLKCPFS